MPTGGTGANHSARPTMNSIYLAGTEEQKQKWLPPMARMEKVGCFALTEPLVGSGTRAGLTTTAKREGDTWILNGQKRWIGNAPWCDISIVWARDEAERDEILLSLLEMRAKRQEETVLPRTQAAE